LEHTLTLLTALLLNRPARALIGTALLLVTLLVAESAKAAAPVTIVTFGDSTTAGPFTHTITLPAASLS